MVKYYLTWGIGYGSKLTAEKNALYDANISSLKIKGLDKLEIPIEKFIENKEEVEKLKGGVSGIVLKKCIKGEIGVALAFGITSEKIFIGKGKAGSLKKAIGKAVYDVRKLNIEFERIQDLAANAEAKKGEYSCAVVALIIK